MVETTGFEPATEPCEGSVFPIKLRPQLYFKQTGGADGTRTHNLLHAMQAIFQLIYSPRKQIMIWWTRPESNRPYQGSGSLRPDLARRSMARVWLSVGTMHPLSTARFRLGLSLFMKAPHQEDTVGCCQPTFRPEMVFSKWWRRRESNSHRTSWRGHYSRCDQVGKRAPVATVHHSHSLHPQTIP